MIETNSIKTWYLAARPKTLTAAAVPVLLGIALAYKDAQQIQTLPALLCLLFAWVMQIDSNLVNDYLRRFYKKQEISSYMYDHAETCTNDTESRIISDDLAALEQRKLSVLPTQRRKIYTMSRFEDKSIADISSELNLSHRTVENHLRIGRHEVREYIRQCI
mgnify:CR=1 FL=1